MTTTLYFLSLYQQRVLGDSPLRTGLALVPMSAVLTLGAIASKSLLPRFGARSNFAVHILGPTLVWAAGASIVTMPCVALATAPASMPNTQASRQDSSTPHGRPEVL